MMSGDGRGLTLHADTKGVAVEAPNINSEVGK